ncbi:hypothetical protein GOEFS_124_00280 [Gordonia effusa NBRC 100432]|uniref:Carbohydrate kinase PfkB domain-containing protein n=1 Tax=Gordonia effusa NBRC 100432 TaxID=1077974 RepID=H0R6J5_9ACTN|nr:carbohydrate kinase family protein [Gordonia effusa]GAB20696.1 hypothetical protein GOEFS_124_00280 [Gordonia effusa NBRC 100432]
MKVVCAGVHVLDVLVRPVDGIPAGQNTALVEQMHITAAGTAAGTALTLAKLGAQVWSAGAIGDDPAGDLLVSLLDRAGIHTSTVIRKPGLSTSMSVLPIRPNGERPSLHLLGANYTFAPADIDWDVVGAAEHLHLGGPELLGPQTSVDILDRAKSLGLTTSVDLIAPGELGSLDAIAAALPFIDYLLPNDEQVIGFTGQSDLHDGARVLLEAGAGTVIATRGADGALIAGAEFVENIPAFDIDVVDTSGCGDAFSAGFLFGLSLGRDLRGAALLGSAAAAQVAQGLGSDHGDFDLESLDAFAVATQRSA